MIIQRTKLLNGTFLIGNNSF